MIVDRFPKAGGAQIWTCQKETQETQGTAAFEDRPQ
jgi:hypothetical protein